MMTMRLLAAVWMSLVVAFTSAHHPTAGGAGGHKGFSLGIRDSIMIAHSFEGPQFGPAQEVRLTSYWSSFASVNRASWGIVGLV